MTELWYPKAIRADTPWQSNGPINGRNWPYNVTIAVQHHTDGAWGEVYDVFGPNSERKVSAHFQVRRDGQVDQFVRLDNIAWHSGQWNVNVSSVGIEHEQFQDETTWSSWTDVQLAASADLQRWLRAQMPAYDMRPHHDFTNTSCPGDLPYDMIRRIMDEGEYLLTESTFFKETGHNLSGGFRSFWMKYGGLAIFGYPISEEMQVTGSDGKPLTVQYFERARFEWHPGSNPAMFDVMLTRLGADAYASRAK